MVLLPGITTRSGSPNSDARPTYRTRTPASWRRGSKSSKLAICGRRHHRHINRVIAFRRRFRPETHRVFFRNVNVIEIRHHACDWHPGAFVQEFQPRRQQRRIAPELIDHVPAHQRPFLRLQQNHRSDELSKDSAAVDVADEQHGCIGVKGHPHVDDVVVLEIDLGRTAGAFNHDDVKFVTQLVEGRR